MACWIRLMEGQARTSQKEAEKLRKQQTRYTIHHSPCVVARRFLLLLGVAALGAFSSYARASTAGQVNRAPAGQTRVARGEKGRGVGRSRHDENTTRVAITANCTPARRPIPSARVRSIAALGELRFRRQHAILLVARARPDLVGALATRGLLQAWRYLEGFSLTH